MSLQERQVKPIYDALETGSFKAALQACNKLLRKQPAFELVKALKALTLARAGKAEESSSLCDEIIARKPTEDVILATLSHSLRTLGRHDDVTAMYDEAFKKQPGNEELGAQAFMANAKISNWKVAQQISTKMYKTFKEDRYLYWSVMSAVLQASLAEAHKLLLSPAGRSLCDTSLVIDEVRSQVAVKRGFWKVEGDLARQRLDGVFNVSQSQSNEEQSTTRRDRNWLTFLALLDATFRKQSEFSLKATMPEINRIRDPKEIFREKQLEEEDKAERERLRTKTGEKEASDEQEVVENTLEERIHAVRTFLERLVELDGAEERGSLLSLLELERRIRDESDLTLEDGSYVRLLGLFLRTFGDKPSCYEDLRPYIVTLGDPDLKQWRILLEEIPNDVSNETSLRRLCNAEKFRRVTLRSDEVTMLSESETLRGLLRLYQDALPLGKILPKTDLQPADDLAVLVGEVLVSMWTLSGTVFLIVGAPLLALDHYHTLNPKQMQTDTLSHLILSRAATFSLAAIGDLTMSNECLEASQIYAANSTEVRIYISIKEDRTAEMIARAFQHEKYSQVQDFILFEDRLDNSLQRDLTKIEHVRMRLAHEPAVPEIIDVELLEFRFIFDRIHHDNRDFTVLPDHQPKNQSFDLQTVLGSVHPAFGWLEVWLKIYVRALTQASDYDESAKNRTIDPLYLKLVPRMEDPRPLKERVATASEEELTELTPDEQLFWEYTTALAEWLEPHHEAIRPRENRAVADTTALEAAVRWQDPPTILTGYYENVDMTYQTAFADVMRRLDQVSSEICMAWEALHVAQLAQEAFVLFSIQTARFKTSTKRKNDPLTQAIKLMRLNIVASLAAVSNRLQKYCEAQNSLDNRKNLVAIAEKITPGVMDYDFSYDIAKKMTDARRRIFEGVVKGIAKISTTHA
ncbi:hypothetical protein Clacol_005786 [Clathrus columnatus]|uniref:Actin cytoskeleton organization protein n=1 Tax=Clathrus columnatus TaxID=1419009 RepID=A0AAV5AAA0_9AGAM|nr:hypothetical protein Clacol_005786 [Clathrus columnatus]